MRKLVLTAALGAACLGLAACGGSEKSSAGNDTAASGGTGESSGAASGGGTDANASGTATGSAGSTTRARIVEEGGKVYRIEPGGNRIELPDTRIEVADGVRYRVDRSGTRVRIDEEGIDVDLPDLTPDVDIGVNEKGNPDIDVKTDKDGDKGPN